MKYLNIAIFLTLSAIFLVFSSHIKFSSNFLELFFSNQTVQLLKVVNNLELSNNILIAKKGFSETSLTELYTIKDKLEKLPQIDKVTISLLPSDKMKNYYKKNYYLLADFNNSKLNKQKIKNKLQQKYDDLQNSFIYVPLDTNDPLELFNIKYNEHGRYLKLKDYGYVLKAKTNIDTTSADKAKILYDKLNQILAKHNDTIIYAPFFFLVENSSYIKADTQFIITLSTILLLILYFFMLKDYKLLANTIIAIGSSVLSAILLSALFFSEINILVLAFGISITTISIDYMFHYYFHGDFSSKKFIKQKSVFFGFLTTFGVFVIFSFIELKLFRELAFFSMVSLLSAYIIFSWTFSHLNIKTPYIKQTQTNSKHFNPIYILTISFLLLAYSYTHLKFDDNLKNLDYKNEKLLNLSKEFNDEFGSNKYQTILLKAKTKELLLQKYEKLKQKYPAMLGIGNFVFSEQKCKQKLKLLNLYNFDNVRKTIQKTAKEVGFNNAFKNSYIEIKKLKCTMQPLDDMGFKIINYKDDFYTIALLQKSEVLQTTKDIQVLNLSKNISKDMQKSKDAIMKFIAISSIFIVLMLFIVSGFNILYPLTYVVFPLSIVLFFITLFGKINIMHLFALIILVSISIDYGIYMNQTKTLIQTKKAISYALLSTLAGFGMLIVSDTNALHSIGFVITIGIGSIFILMLINPNYAIGIKGKK